MNFSHSRGRTLEEKILFRLDNAPGGLTRTELGKNLGNSEKVGKALEVLVRLGKINHNTERTGGRGRPVEKWRLGCVRFRP